MMQNKKVQNFVQKKKEEKSRIVLQKKNSGHFPIKVHPFYNKHVLFKQIQKWHFDQTKHVSAKYKNDCIIKSYTNSYN